MKKMDEYFNEEAAMHDDLFIQRMGLDEFYDEVEKTLNNCSNKGDILVLGCGSGLEIERIKFPSNVVGVDISDKMLEVLNKKKLHKDVKLTTVCASFLDLDFGNNQYDVVLSCYALHHFNCEQKQIIFDKIYSCLREGGVFINGDSMAYDREEEDSYLSIAERIYAKENLPFASLHLDAPFCFEHEEELLKDAKFSDVKIIKEWTNTKLYISKKS